MNEKNLSLLLSKFCPSQQSLCVSVGKWEFIQPS